MTWRPKRLLTGIAAALLVGALLPPSPAMAATQNPIIGDGSVYSADPTLLVDGDTLYIHAGRDEAGTTTNDFIMNEWQAFSTTDVDSGVWEHHPSLMRPEAVFSWATSGRAYAGQVVEGADGRFYWYVPVHEAASTSSDKFGIGVAVSDTPLGPWTDHAGGPIVSQSILGNDAHNIDPTVFVDDDGRVWMYWGSFGRLLAVELSSDMKTRIGSPTTITSGVTGFFEAAWLFKRNETYYLAYAANNAGPTSTCTPANYHACIAYSTASSPLGPWTYRGPILAPVSSTTSHPAIAEFKGEWYLAYHTADAVGGNHFRRSVAIDRLEWDDTQTPARIKPVVTTPERGLNLTPRSNVAPWATASASNEPIPTQYWIRALNDEIIRPNPLPPDMWGSWTSNRPAQQWIQYDWERPVRLDKVRIKFWRDVAPGTGNGVSDPSSWVLQYWDAGLWKDVPNPSGYPTSTTAVHQVTFSPVTTSRLRAVLNASPNSANPPQYSALAVEEWEAHAAQPDSVAPVAVTTDIGIQPDLPDTVTLNYGSDTVAAPVRWDAVEEADLAGAGEFAVSGFAQGYAGGRVTATVTVRGEPDGEQTPDTVAPEVVLSTTGTAGGSGWFVSPVTVRATAQDDRDVRTRIEVAVGSGAWQATENVRFVDTLVSGDGTHTVKARATDAAGNVSEVASTEVRIDTVKPTVQASLAIATRAVTAIAADTGSGVGAVEYAIDAPAGWQPYTGPVTVDSERRVVYLRARDVAGNISTLASVTVPLAPDAPLHGNIAPLATPTASYTSAWNSVTAVNDGSLTGAQWGTWPVVGEQWVKLEWDRVVTIDRAGVMFFRDSTDASGVGMIPPRSWKLQYVDLSTGQWVDVPTGDTYGRASDAVNEISFTAPVTTTALRAVMQAWGSAEAGGSSGMWEFQAWAAEQTEPERTLDVAVAVTSRCVAGRVTLATTTTNADEIPVAFAVSTPYGGKTVAALDAGKSASQAFSSRLTTMPAGTVTVVASGTIDGEPLTRDLVVDYDARSCG
ncbi:MAG TPA: family 43 glycosylhydrolase [Arachnia sp.]|nr:family 43 glycosylhydrolase [Arachnia sp.]HMT85814.1 family 43 glycosylhydrolase [Arachnia sp.]